MSLRRVLICAACLTTFTTLPAGPARAEAPGAGRARCSAAVQDPRLRAAVYAAPGWRVRCVSSIHVPGFSDAIGLTVSDDRLILVNARRGDPRAILAHELAHAFSVDRMSPGLRAAFARTVGHRAFSAGTSWATTPAEIWAFNQARCAGYTTAARTRTVSCRVIRSFVRAAG